MNEPHYIYAYSRCGRRWNDTTGNDDQCGQCGKQVTPLCYPPVDFHAIRKESRRLLRTLGGGSRSQRLAKMPTLSEFDHARMDMGSA